MAEIIHADVVKLQLPESDPDFKIAHFNTLVGNEIKRIRECGLNGREVFQIELAYAIFGTQYEVIAEFVEPSGYVIFSADNVGRVWKIRIK